jgi:ribosomal protein S18 acetylase RimI-like enzyme
MTANTGEAIRLRRYLEAPMKQPNWPKALAVRTLQESDATSVHALLTLGAADYGGVATGFDDWWASLSTNPEFDPALCFLAVDEDQKILGVAQCWTSAYLKDLAVHPQARRCGVGENLLWQVFQVFCQRGASHVDLKVVANNVAARRLYDRVGMVEVAFDG